MAVKHFVLSLLTLFSLGTSLLFVNCANPGNNSSTTAISPIELLGTGSLVLDGVSYKIENYKLNTSDGAVYFQVLPGCTDKCPVAVISMPYNGIPWTTEAADVRWSTDHPTGALTADVDGPDYVPGSGQQIAYFHSSLAETAGFGGIFLPSNVTAVLVYSRFYLGRKVDHYVNDFVSVVNELSRFSYVDTAKMGFLGSSLGGFISLHASRKTNRKPVAIAGLTPLLDLKSEQTEMSTVSSRITTNPALLLSTQNFFNSYLRRMNGVTVDDYTSQSIANENLTSEILVIHDTWDTIVSINQYNTFSTQRALDSYIFQHATGLNFNTFTMAHAQASEGYTNDKVAPVYMAYLLKRLKPNNEDKIIYYTSPQFLTGVSEIKLAQQRSQSISWFKNFIEDLCTDGFLLKDYSTVNNLGTLTGRQMAGGIIANVWGQPTTIENGCSFLQANPNIFN